MDKDGLVSFIEQLLKLSQFKVEAVVINDVLMNSILKISPEIWEMEQFKNQIDSTTKVLNKYKSIDGTVYDFVVDTDEPAIALKEKFYW